MQIFRFLKIVYIALRYRLDTLFHARFGILGSVFNILLFWVPHSKPRGERLRLALVALGPIFVKFGQMLSTRRDLIPPDIADALSQLQDRVPPVPYAEVERTIGLAFNQPLTKIFSQFDEMPVASASVAQVHFAHLPNGQAVAVKVLRPQAEKIITQDLALMDFMARFICRFSHEARQLKPREIVAEFAAHTQNELDLTLEAANCSLLARNFAHDARLAVPTVFWDYCRKTVMTMQRMQGTPISQREALRVDGVDLNQLARDGVAVFFTQAFRDGFFHADMHPGNIQVETTGAHKGRLIALDFGIMGTLSDTDKYYLARNFIAIQNQDYRDVAQAHVDAGWVPADTKISDLENAVRAICEPIFDKPLKDISFGQTLLSLFQMARRFGVVIQPQLIMLQKTLLNIEGLSRDLDPDLDLWKSVQPLLRRWMSEQVGWRSLLKNLRNEIPNIITALPQLPRLAQSYLSRNDAQTAQQAQWQAMQTLIEAQQKQLRWQKWLLLVMLLVLLSCLAVLTRFFVYWLL